MNQTNTARPRGRPTGKIDSGLRQQLIETAERLFAEQGFAATSLRFIGESAGVNPALVNYHFGSKQGLLEAVFEQALEPFAGALQELRESPCASPEQLLGLLHGLALEHPNLLPLLVREALLPGGAMHDTFAERFAPRLGGLFPELIRREKTEGNLDADTDPEALAILMLSMGVFPFIAASLAQRVIGLDLQSGGAERLAQQTHKLLQKGVKP